jgi:hypothetical protein
MRQADVDRILGGGKSGFSSGGGFSYMMWSYPDGLQLDTHGDKVVRCVCSGYSIKGSPATPPPLTDAILEGRLAKGMSPSEVGVIAGPPRYGVETEAGTTDLYYPQPGIAVEYASGVLVRWRRVVVYEDGPPAP